MNLRRQELEDPETYRALTSVLIAAYLHQSDEKVVQIAMGVAKALPRQKRALLIDLIISPKPLKLAETIAEELIN